MFGENRSGFVNIEQRCSDQTCCKPFTPRLHIIVESKLAQFNIIHPGFYRNRFVSLVLPLSVLIQLTRHTSFPTTYDPLETRYKLRAILTKTHYLMMKSHVYHRIYSWSKGFSPNNRSTSPSPASIRAVSRMSLITKLLRVIIVLFIPSYYNPPSFFPSFSKEKKHFLLS